MIRSQTSAVWLFVISTLLGCAPSTDRKFCEIRFGAPNTQRITLALDSNALLVYRDSDITSEPEVYLLENGGLPDGTQVSLDGHNGISYRITSFSMYRDEEPSARHALMLNVKVEHGDRSFNQYCDVELSSNPRSVKYAHFDGPMEISVQHVNWKVPDNLQFEIGGETDIKAHVGTFDVADECWTVVETGQGKFPDGVHPYVTVEFPTTDEASPIVKQYPLDQFC